MNSKQRRKANRAYKILQDFVVVRLRLSGEVNDEEIQVFLEQENFLLRKNAPQGSYWKYLTNAGKKIGLLNYAKARNEHGRLE